MEFNPMIEASKFWTLRGNPAILTGRRLKRENAEFVHNGVKHGVVFLNIGDTHLEKDIIVPAMVKEAIHRAIESQRICYTFSEGDPALIKSIAHHYDIPEAEIFIVNGVTESIFFLARLMAQVAGSPRDAAGFSRRANWPNIILVSPVYPPWSGILMEHGLKLELAERHIAGRQKGQPDIAQMKNKMNPSTQGIVLIPADNPTGKVLTTETVEGVANLIKKRQHKGQNIFLIVDNIYHEFIKPNNRVNYFRIADKYKVPLIFMGGVDKTLGTGFHGGWMIIHIPTELEQLHRKTLESMRVLFAKYLGANTLTQYAMMPYFNEYEMVLTDIKKNLAKFHLWCNKFIRGFKVGEKTLLRFKYGVPELPLYLWLEIIPKKIWPSATEFADDLVRNTGILVAPGDPFGDNECIRISVVRDPVKPLNIPQIILDFIRKRMGQRKSK
ncbi:MAG: pyridoxal phosphate-dependent aminotransferase [Planctomycetes bacterium]|nr:pyridoxal phosphate-dependent aminotransferase [Planctomycetota bacterium]